MLRITKKTLKNKKSLNAIRRVLYTIVETICETVTFADAVEIVSRYYGIKKKTVKCLLKFTKFDEDIVCIIRNKEGKEFLTHCNYLFTIYRSINKLIYNLHKEENIPVMTAIKMMGEILHEHDPDGFNIVFNAIKIELRKKSTKYKNFYLRNFDKKIVELFKELEFDDKVSHIFSKIDKSF